jgi:hypothetical protein
MYYSVLLVTFKRTFLMAKIVLRLNDSGTNLVNPGDRRCGTRYPEVKWKVDEESGLAKIRIISKIPGGYYPFRNDPPTDFSDKVSLKGGANTEPGDWEYSIEWLSQWNTKGTYDPKIAVRPSRFSEIILLFLAIFGISGLVLYRRWLKNRAA